MFAEAVSGCRVDRQVSLPPTVGTRRKRRSETVRRRSSRLDSASVGKSNVLDGKREEAIDARQEVALNTPLEEVRNEEEEQKAGPNCEFELEISELPAVRHSTPEPPQRPTRQNKKKPTQATARGRRPDRAPLKKPWENPKPRARSKSRDRSQSRARAPLPPADRLNSSLGGNDTFDFDCEEAVHLTPFRAGNKAAEKPSSDAAADKEDEAMETDRSLSEDGRDEDDSPYVPKRKSRRARSPPARRARSKRRSVQEARGNTSQGQRTGTVRCFELYETVTFQFHCFNHLMFHREK